MALDLPDGAGERRLGHRQPFRGPAEMQFLGHRDEVPQLADLEVTHIATVSIESGSVLHAFPGRTRRLDAMIVVTAPTGNIGRQVVAEPARAGPARPRHRPRPGPPGRRDVRRPGRGRRRFAPRRRRGRQGLRRRRGRLLARPARPAGRRRARPATSSSAARPPAPSPSRACSGWSASRPWAAARPGAARRPGHRLAGDGRPDRRPRRALPRAGPAVLHGQRAPAGPGDPGSGRYFGPSDPDRKMPAVAIRDIAAAAARLLLDDGWTGAGEVPVLGPEDLSIADEVRIMSEVLGSSGQVRPDVAGGVQGPVPRSAGRPSRPPRRWSTCTRPRSEGLDAFVTRTAGDVQPDHLPPVVRAGARAGRPGVISRTCRRR